MKYENRDKAICEMVLAGSTYEETGEVFGLSKEMIRLIIKKYPKYYLKIQTNMYAVCAGCEKKRRGVKERYRVKNLCFECGKKRKQQLIRDKKKSWAIGYDACLDCGTIEKPHKGQGRCSKCLSKFQYSDPEFRKKHAEYAATWSARNKDKIKEKNLRAYARKRNSESNNRVSDSTGE